MANHVIYDRIWESQKLARCSLKAALAYPWIYLVADDWGRFEYSPRIIWGKVFGAREDVRKADVVAWLAEYEAVGLLLRYRVGGLDLCAWTRFTGPPPSKRHAATLPAPDGTLETEGVKPKTRFQAAATPLPSRSQEGELEAGNRKQEAGNRKQEAGNGKQERQRRLAPDDPARLGQPGEAEALRGEIAIDLAETKRITGRPYDEILVEASDTGRGAITNLASCWSVPWLRVTRDRAKAMKLRAQGQARASPNANPKAEQRERVANAELMGGLGGRRDVAQGVPGTTRQLPGPRHDRGDGGDAG